MVGAGPVGLAFALGAASLRHAEVTLIERQTLALARPSEQNPLNKAELFDS